MENEKLEQKTVNQNTNSVRHFNKRQQMTRIGTLLLLTLIICAGLFFGLLTRFIAGPRLVKIQFDDFDAALPFEPKIQEIPGIKPLETNTIKKYEAVTGEDEAYQILEIQYRETTAEENRNQYNDVLSLSEGDKIIRLWAENTIAVMCAEETGAVVAKDCLQTGSRPGHWHLINANGTHIRGSLVKGKNGKVFHLLAIGLDEKNAEEFFAGFHAK